MYKFVKLSKSKNRAQISRVDQKQLHKQNIVKSGAVQ